MINGIVNDESSLNEYLVKEINKLHLNQSIISQIRSMFVGFYEISRVFELYTEEVWEICNNEDIPVIQVTLDESNFKNVIAVLI